MSTLYHLNLSRTGEAALDPFMGETPFSPSQKVMIKNLPKMPTKGSALGFKLRDSLRPHELQHTWYPTPVLLPGKYHGWRSLVGCSPWGR